MERLLNLVVFLLPFVLAMTYFSISLSNASEEGGLKKGTAMKASVLFALSAWLLFIAGHYVAGFVEKRTEGDGGFVVFLMLMLTGAKVLHHAWRKKAFDRVFDINQVPVILALAFALGINVLFVGVAARFIGIPLMKTSAILFGMVWFFSFSGLLYGPQFSKNFGRIMEFVAGAILVFMAVWVFQ